jgi:hypothetical protein
MGLDFAFRPPAHQRNKGALDKGRITLEIGSPEQAHERDILD